MLRILHPLVGSELCCRWKEHTWFFVSEKCDCCEWCIHHFENPNEQTIFIFWHFITISKLLSSVWTWLNLFWISKNNFFDANIFLNIFSFSNRHSERKPIFVFCPYNFFILKHYAFFGLNSVCIANPTIVFLFGFFASVWVGFRFSVT